MKDHPLRRYRQEKRLTQNALAIRLGVYSITVSRWESGRRNIDVELLPRISRLTGISPAELRPDLAALFEST
jgi:tellurite methyltransferase